ncbi:PAS domain-containing sensor histidine kinase [Hydrogenophaga taeniospiralis]|uniref:PAS domain-containing sensor histidine kinase n=1 Tax=Hydrogenophaga taeniospiralis TaxID=65656 RepID=UPI001CFA1439|nr:PAS domain-containing sensor histidine kinase [Hydrogenophaga taeniospiralis]UCU92832.1 PAS domain S-box protein [Hydrogenophaga taeniospiralis]
MYNPRSSTEPTEMDAVVQSGAIHAALEGIVTIDEAMHIVMINPAAQRMFGQPAAQLLGQDLSVLIPGALRELHRAHVQKFMASEVAERSMGDRGQLLGLRADGTEFPLEAAICQVEASSKLGGHRYFTAMLRDVSNEQKLAAQVDQLNRRMRTLFDLLPVAIWITEGELVVYANSACARLFGVAQRESLTGQSIYALLHPATHEQVREKVAHALASEDEVLPMHGKIARHDGSSRDVEMVVAALPDHSRTLVQMVLSDITKQSQERRALLASRRTLRDLAASLVDTREEEQRRLARELHDELGQRLTALKLELSAPESIGAPGIPSARIQSMIQMVDDTMAATRRISLDLRPLMLDDLGLNAAIEWLAQEYERRARLQVTLRCDPLPDQLPQKVLSALYRIVQEALTNIVRHADATRVAISIVHTGSSIELRVEDNGAGFPEQPLRVPGKSFGLIGIRERVLMLGGDLSLGNLPDGGASMVVKLPMSGSDVSEEPLESAAGLLQLLAGAAPFDTLT